ncbi:MAG TPA: ABC transporter permease [Vicinamibacterales bacterium]|nr:ABC transporter permease [Vicinamibacterales bacterium]
MTGPWQSRLTRLRSALARRAATTDLDDEFDTHLDLAASEYQRQGHSPADARRLAAVRFGSRVTAREAVHEAQGFPSLERAWTDLRYAARSLWRAPRFAIGAVLVLALGIGINVAVFTVANAALFRGFAGLADQDRLVYLTTGPGCCVSYQDVLDWRAAARSVEDIAAVADLRVAFDAGTGAETATATEVTTNTFTLLGARPALGRDFVANDDRPGADPVVMLSDRFWRAKMLGDPGVLGHVVHLNGVATTIIGVMPAEFVFPQNQDLWLPVGPRVTGEPRSARALWFAVGRLAPGVTPAEARAEFETIGAGLATAYPETNAGITPWVQTFPTMFIGREAPAIYGALWAGVTVLLTITCVNIASLLLARAMERTREASIRLALGAGHWRIIRQHLFESLLLAAGGGIIGTGVAQLLLLGYATTAVPPTQPWAAHLLDYRMDGEIAVYVMGVAVLSGLAVGIAPALRMGVLDVMTALRDGGRGTVGARSRRRTAHALVATQVALAVLLLSGAGVLARSFLIVQGRDLGFDPSHVLTTLTRLPESRYPDAVSQFRYLDRIAANLRGIPEIRSVAFSDSGVAQRGGRSAFDIDGVVAADPAHRPQVRAMAVSPGYFDVIGASSLQGRDFDERDGTGDRQVLIVSRRFAQTHWPAQNAVGARMRLYAGGTAGPWLTVVGVAPDLRHGDPAQAEIEPMVYVPLRQRPAQGAWVLARTAVPPQRLRAEMRRVVQNVDPEVPLWLGPYALTEWRAGTYWRRGVNSGLALTFAVAALVIAAIGLFAMLAQDVARRSKELAVRVTLGATRRGIAWLVVRGGLVPASVGLAMGVVASLGTNRLLSAQLVDVPFWDPLTLTVSGVVLVIAALAGCALPARRATRTEPLVALRLD